MNLDEYDVRRCVRRDLGSGDYTTIVTISSAKCDGNHGGPRCGDPECWNDSPPEPVAWLDEFGNTFPLAAWAKSEVKEKWRPLYLHPPAQREPVVASTTTAPEFDVWCEQQWEWKNYYYRQEGPGEMAVLFARKAFRAGAALAEQPVPFVKCDGNHGGPRCGDPECWNDSPQSLLTEDAAHGRCAFWLQQFCYRHGRDPYPQEVWDAARAVEHIVREGK